MAFGPDGKFYIAIGGPCNSCEPGNPDHGTMIRTEADGTGRVSFAKGLRNTIGFDWHPTTRELWGMDHGSDMRGDDQPPEELNKLIEGKDYGWPACFGDRHVDPDYTSRAEYCKGTAGMTLGYQAHSAPLGLVFYNGDQFPAEYKGSAFVTFRGSWNREPPTGYKVVLLRFKDGQPQGFEDFLSGFLLEGGKSIFGRPTGIVVSRDGSLLFADDTNGVVYRVSYRKP